MKKILALFIFMVNIQLVSAQATLVVYERSSIAKPSFTNEVKYLSLLFNDTMSFSHYGVTKKVATLSYSKLIQQKSFYHTDYNFTKWPNHRIFLFNMHAKPKQWYLVFDTISKKKWVNVEGEKTIVGIQCKAMLSVDSEGDSTLVYYSLDSTKPFSPYSNSKMPGLVLEIFDQKYDYHCKAIEIKATDDKLAIPSQYNYVSKDSYNDELQRRRGNIFIKRN